MKSIVYQGLLSEHSWGEVDDLLFLSSIEAPLAEKLQDEIANKQVSLRYWVTEKEVTKEQATESVIQAISGLADCNFGSNYSEVTGYLWTDEDCKVGGHDLLLELHSYVGKWLILEIDIHEDTECQE